jgi:hypothetical protein
MHFPYTALSLEQTATAAANLTIGLSAGMMSLNQSVVIIRRVEANRQVFEAQ